MKDNSLGQVVAVISVLNHFSSLMIRDALFNPDSAAEYSLLFIAVFIACWTFFEGIIELNHI